MTRGVALQLVAGPVLAILWALVAWGSLLVLVTLHNAVRDGVGPVVPDDPVT